eukprot:CAMPEP_0196581976 /NCGR_PEP_ID=MMETSP1081-20130531/36768_1 /TAXON_ID=36882 /ORGANISM="Pyramimonas amylifera, Strain CCMP720" /LENGTH=539 /DNA_ID=CAMNT_0041902409 /DNA_START=194 /DNA_END=1813 /DNA_ORIENTATION=+
MTRLFLVMCVLIIGVYIIDIEEMAVVGDRVKNRLHGAKPFWQSTEEIMERMTADGQAFTEHQHQAENEIAGIVSDVESLLPVPSTAAEGPLIRAPQPTTVQGESTAGPEMDSKSSLEEEGEDKYKSESPEEDSGTPNIGASPSFVSSPLPIDSSSGVETEEREEAPPEEERVGSENQQVTVQVPEVEVASEVATEVATPAVPVEVKSPASDPQRNAGYSAMGVWPPPQCKLQLPVSTPPLTSTSPHTSSSLPSASAPSPTRTLLSEAPTQLLVKKSPPDITLRNQVYDYIRDFYASNVSCTPRSIDTASQKCSGSGGGNSCRGFEKGQCRLTGPWDPSQPLGSHALFPWPSSYKGPNGVEPLGSWGSCAFVATGETVLVGKFGEDIDSHDTVIRYNTPIRGYEQYVGKTAALMWSKSKYGTEIRPSKGYIASKVPGQSPLYHPAIGNLRIFRDQVYRMWFQARKIKEGKAAAGFARAVGLVKSGMCTSVSLYGFHTKPSRGGGKYFDRKAVVTQGHTIDWDGWLLKAMMDLGYLCVYGE